MLLSIGCELLGLKHLCSCLLGCLKEKQHFVDNEFRRSKAHCSASALAQILKGIKDNGVPELTGRRAFREARDLVAAAEGPYGPILQSIQCVANEGPPHGTYL